MSTERFLPESTDKHTITLGLVTALGLRHWKFVAGFAVACAVLAAGISLVIPNKYTATSTILPISDPLETGLFRALAQDLPGFDMLGSQQGNSTTLLFPEILESRLVAEKVLTHEYDYGGEKGSLQEYLRADNLDRACRSLKRIVEITYDKKTGVVGVSATTKHPELSAQVANYYVQCLDDFNKFQRKTSAGQNREFIGKRISDAREELEQAELSLKNFRDGNLNYYRSTDPELLMLHDQLVRQVQVKSQVYLTLVQQFELAAVQEKKETPLVQILDTAQPPTLKSSPARLRTTVLAFLLGLLMSLAMVVIDHFRGGQTQYAEVRRLVSRLRLVRRFAGADSLEHDVAKH